MTLNLRRTILLCSDVLAISSAALVSHALTYEPLFQSPPMDSSRMSVVYTILAAACIAYFHYKGHYKWRNPWWQQVRQTLRTCFILMMLCLLTNYIALPDVNAQTWIVLSWFLSSLFILAFRWGGRYVLKRVDHWDIPTVLIGGPENLTETLYALRSEPYLSYNVQCVIIEGGTKEEEDKFRALHPDLNIVPELLDIKSRLMVILCPERNNPEFLEAIIQRIIEAGARFAVVPPTYGFSLYGLQTQFFFGHKIVLLESRNRARTFMESIAKALVDRLGAALGIILLSPAFIILALVIRKDGGPAFYGQTRVGKSGKKFKCWKFRSMVVNSDKALQEHLEQNHDAREEYEKDFKLKNDPRITPIGKFIRKTSLDEIPQFFNVIKGEMSLVGPRPIVDAEIEFYGDKFDHYLSVRPGITGMWQVSGRNDVTYEERVSLDVWYVDNWTVWNDIVIILKTIYVVLARKGAY